MSPERLEELADIADPDKLWSRPLRARETMSVAQRAQLDTGVALRRYAMHITGLRAALKNKRSVLITPLAENSTAVKQVKTPAAHEKLR